MIERVWFNSDMFEPICLCAEDIPITITYRYQCLLDFLFSQLKHLKLQNSTFLKSSDKGLKAQRHMIKQWQPHKVWPFIAWFSTYLIRLPYQFKIALRAKFELVSVWPNFGKIGRTAMPLQLGFEISETYCVRSHWKFFAILFRIILAHCYNSFTLKCFN